MKKIRVSMELPEKFRVDGKERIVCGIVDYYSTFTEALEDALYFFNDLYKKDDLDLDIDCVSINMEVIK